MYASDLLFADLASLTLDVSFSDKHFNILNSYRFIFTFFSSSEYYGFFLRWGKHTSIPLFIHASI